jgi:hypothetical protein
MSIGGVFILISVLLFFLAAIGMRVIPAIDLWAHCALGLGILLGAFPLGPFWRRP